MRSNTITITVKPKEEKKEEKPVKKGIDMRFLLGLGGTALVAYLLSKKR